MNNTVNRQIQIGNWIFEVKMVRALRVQNYGEAYSAIATINLNGSTANIDGMMQKDQQQIPNQDIESLKEYCQQMSVKEINIDSQNSFSTTASMEEDISQLKLV